MHDAEVHRAAAIHQIASIFAVAYLRLRFPDPLAVDCAETKSESCDVRLTA